MRNRSPRSLFRNAIAATILVCALPCARGGAAHAFELSEFERYMNPSKVAVAQPATERQSDEAFLEDLLEADPGAAVDGADAAEVAADTRTRAHRRETVRWFNEFATSNRKPGYSLFMDEDPDYESVSYRTGVEASLGERIFVKAVHSSRTASESGTGEVTLGKTGVSATLRAPGIGSFTARADALDLGAADGATQYGVGGSGKAGPVRLALDLDRKVYATDAASAAKPAEYDRVALRAGYAIDELFLQVSPAFETYRDDGNSKRELFASVSWDPVAAPGWTFDLHGEASSFAKERGDAGAFVYFSPGARESVGAGVGNRMAWGDALSAGLGLSLDRESYTSGGEETSYYLASWQAGAEWTARPGLAFTLEYDGSLSQSDGFPFSQSFRGGLEAKF